MATIKQEAEKGANLTVLGCETVFEGKLRFTDNLTIRGRFSGTITATGHLAVDKGAQCTVDTICAESIVTEGAVTGNMQAASRIELKKGSVIHGDLTTARLRIADGVIFDGEVTMLPVDTAVDLFAQGVDEAKTAIQEAAIGTHED